MNNDTTINEVTINNVTYVRKDLAPCAASIPLTDAVIVRCYAGVYFGTLVSKSGKDVELKNARQIWSWGSKGLKEPVNTCGDIALRGVGTDSRVSSPTPKVLLTQVSAIFYCSAEAVACLNDRKWQ